MRLLPACVVLALASSASVQDWSCAPRMKRQPSLRPYEPPERGRLPEPPAGSVPWDGSVGLPTAEQAATLGNPVAPTADALARGRVYYGYYCAVCHGADGRGHVPVGESYHPAPADLSSARVQSKTDGELCRAMLVGTGHEPTLGYIVPPERRWLIVLHVRTLGTAAGR